MGGFCRLPTANPTPCADGASAAGASPRQGSRCGARPSVLRLVANDASGLASGPPFRQRTAPAGRGLPVGQAAPRRILPQGPPSARPARRPSARIGLARVRRGCRARWLSSGPDTQDIGGPALCGLGQCGVEHATAARDCLWAGPTSVMPQPAAGLRKPIGAARGRPVRGLPRACGRVCTGPVSKARFHRDFISIETHRRNRGTRP